MERISDDHVHFLGEKVKAIIRQFYSAIVRKDTRGLGDLVANDIFVLGSGAKDVSIGRIEFISKLHDQLWQMKDDLRVKVTQERVGISDSGRSAWFFASFVLEVVRDEKISRSIPIRVTGLCVQRQDWLLAAAYWSIPLRGNEYQYSLLKEGKISAGVALGEHISLEAQPLAQLLSQAVAQPLTMSELYSTGADAITVGSTVDEILLADAGKNFVGEIVQLPLKFTIRGGIRAALAPDNRTAWMATNIDLSGGLTTPYRFFYVWQREQDGWKIVVSHDAVVIDAQSPGFEVP